MNKDSSDFMLTEYERISSEYLGLQVQVNDWFKAYLTIIGFPLTVLAAALKLGSADISASINFLPDIVAGVLILVSVLGLFVAFATIAMRMEMILYIHTINFVRRFFGDNDAKLVPYFILPIDDKNPPFYEEGSAVFWQIVLMGLVDGLIAGLGFNNLFRTDWFVGLAIGVGFFLLHVGFYRFFAMTREKEWKQRLSENLGLRQLIKKKGFPKILVDLDKRRLAVQPKR